MGVLVVLLTLIIHFNINVIAFNYKYVENIGIIDTSISSQYRNSYDLAIAGNKNYIPAEETHGDKLIEFLNKIKYNGKIHYYIAINNNKIDTNSLLKGLAWLKSRRVTRVNISLSSHNYDVNLQKWVNQNPDIKIFASYNNELNTKDYPAMYKGVVGVGADDTVVSTKNIDTIYNSNRTLVLPFGGKKLGFFEGNSFLTLFVAVRK